VRGRERNGNNLWHRKASQIPDTRTRRAQNKECRIVADANSSRGIALRDGRLQGESESGSFSAQLDGTRRRRLYTPFNAQFDRYQPDPWLATHTLSRKTPPHPDFERCLALALEQSLTESRPRFRARRGYSAAQAAIKTKPTAKPGRRRTSPRFDTYSLVIPASCPDTVRSQTGMTSRLRPHARRRPFQRNGR
jgi:hypothetical protein